MCWGEAKKNGQFLSHEKKLWHMLTPQHVLRYMNSSMLALFDVASVIFLPLKYVA